MSRYSALAIESIYNYFVDNLATELRRVETENTLGANYLKNPTHFYGVHPSSPPAISVAYYVRPDGIEPLNAGQRNQMWCTHAAVEVRLRGPAPNPETYAQQGSAGAYMQNDYYRLYHYLAAVLGMFEPRGSDAGGASFRPTLGGTVTAAIVENAVMVPESAEEDSPGLVGFTVYVKIMTTNPVVA